MEKEVMADDKLREIYRLGPVVFYVQVLTNPKSPFVGTAYYGSMYDKITLLSVDVRCLN